MQSAKANVLLLGILLLITFNTVSAALAFDNHEPGAGNDYSRLRQLTNEIITAQIELERFYLQYRIIACSEPRWRWLRYPLLQDAQSGAVLAADIVQIAEFGKHLYTPNKVSNKVVRRGLVTGLVGVILGASASGVELGSNGLTAIKNVVQKHNPACAKQEFQQKLKEMDELFKQLDVELSNSRKSQTTDLFATEERILKLYRDWEVSEFADLYADVKSNQAGNNVFYLLNLASNAVSTPGYIYSIRGLVRSKFNGSAAVCSAVGDSISMVSAPASVWAGNLLYKYYHKRFSSEVHEKIYEPEELVKAELSKLEKQIAAADAATLNETGPIANRLSVYAFWTDKFDDYLAKRVAHLKHLQNIAEQNIISGPAISAGGLSQDILNTLAYYEYGKKPKVNNALGFAGGIAGGAATGSAVCLTTTWLIQDALYRRKLSRNHEMPEDTLKSRLQTLVEVENKLGLRK